MILIGYKVNKVRGYEVLKLKTKNLKTQKPENLNMNQKRLITILKVTTPFILGGAILYWMFRNFDFKSMEKVLFEEMNWWWMLLSFPFGILAQAFRGWRWKQTLEPIGENPRTSTTIYSIFISYAASLVVPRIGEFTRCGVLKRWEGTSFPKALGTVVTERAVDSESARVDVLFISSLARKSESCDLMQAQTRRAAKRPFRVHS